MVSGDTCLLDQHDFGARIAFVDYDGGSALKDFRSRPPKGAVEEEEFVLRNAPQMAAATDALREWVEWVVS